MTVTNQKPQTLSPIYTAVASGPFAPDEYIKETIAKPLFTPLLQGHTASIVDNNQPVTEDDIVNKIIACCQDVQDPASEKWCKNLYGATLTDFDKSTQLNMQNLFSIQSGTAAKLPFPSTVVMYTPANDIIPTTKQFMAGKADYNTLFASYAFYARPEILGFYFVNATAFDLFKDWLRPQTQAMSGTYPAITNQLMQEFDQNISLNDLTESLKLRNDDNDNNGDYSFARVIIEKLMEYTKTASSSEFGVMPFHLGELYCPKSIVFINLEKHAHASAKKIADEWQIINTSTSMKIQMISNNKLNKLTAAARNLKHIQAAAANALSNQGAQSGRHANIRFRTTEPNIVDITRYLTKISSKMTQVSRSENSYKAIKMSFNKPNRRDPDDFNKQGKTVSTRYRPDIHVYLDTSGSISEENYKDAIQACIKIAKKLNINLYFNSFSHILSQCTKLNTKDKTTGAIYRQFQKVPKVSGGTDYAQIWEYINKNPKRKRELSLIITDFEYLAPNRFIPHPKNLYYLPCSRCNWNSILHYAKDFCQSMAHIDPAFRRHILM